MAKIKIPYGEFIAGFLTQKKWGGEIQINKKTAQEIKPHDGQAFINDKSKMQFMKMDGITIKPKIKNVYLITK